MTVTAAAGREQIPAEFEQYWRAIEAPRVQRARRAFRNVFRFDPLPSDARLLDLARGYYDADPVAEAFVEEAYIRGNSSDGRAMLDHAIAHGVESVANAPESMTRLFAEFESEPEWLDHELVERGAFLFRRFGPAVFSFEGVATLLAYTESSVARPLGMTGAYAGDAALNRFLETARFWIDVTEPDGLRPGGQGRATAMRVRIMHVFVRQRVARHKEWNAHAWGLPISQSDALITLLAGSYAAGVGMHLLGFRSTRADIAAMMHFWRYVGHLMGVQPRWYLADWKEATQVSLAFFLKRAYTAGADGAELIDSYPRAFAPKAGTTGRKRLRDQLNYRMQLGYTRYLLPGRFYRRYDLPNPWPWAMLPAVQVVPNLLLDLVAHHSPRVAVLQDRYAQWRRHTWLHNEVGDRTAKFAAAEQLRR
jgi:hypothetical protein